MFQMDLDVSELSLNVQICISSHFDSVVFFNGMLLLDVVKNRISKIAHKQFTTEYQVQNIQQQVPKNILHIF